MEEAPVFRAPKRRKFSAKSTGTDQDVEVEVENSSSVVFGRQSSTRRPGTKFSSATRIVHEHPNDQDLGLVQTSSQDGQASGGLQTRFVGAGNSTQVTNTDRYMTDFVDRAMAEKSNLTTHQPTDNRLSSDEYTSSSDTEDTLLPASQASRPVPQPLAEIDLGSTSTSSNFARTAAALTGQPTPDAPTKKQRRRKPRLGRDGKPLRPRPRKGPTTDDLARSALVEQVLQEHGLGTYDGGSATSRGTGIDEAADERMAAEFQQQFLDTVAERQARQTQSTKAKKETTTSDGPRLGGSRNARAKMAAAHSGASSEKK